MAYDYETQKGKLFTEEGIRIFSFVRDAARHHLKFSGAFMARKTYCTGDSWTMQAALDYMCEKGELVLIYGKGVVQDWIYSGGTLLEEAERD